MRFASGLALAAMISVSAAQAETQDERQVRCEAQGEIVAQAAEMRLKRRSEAKAKEAILEEVSEEMKNSVPLLVGYVYTLARKDIRTNDVPAAFIEQCAGFDPNK